MNGWSIILLNHINYFKNYFVSYFVFSVVCLAVESA